MDFYQVPIGTWIKSFTSWLQQNMGGVFDGFRVSAQFLLNQTEDLLLLIPWPLFILVFMLVAWRLRGPLAMAATGVGLYLIGSMGLWSLAMSTLALMLISVLLCLIIGISMGIAASFSPTFYRFLRPLLDVMQTMPAFVYLVPALMFFSFGKVPAVFATIIFAMPPVARLTYLGIQQVPSDAVEAGISFGSTPWQLLWKVQLPLALPNIMAGTNQTVMLALSMSVLAAMIGAGGLGQEVLSGLGNVDVGRSFEGGLAIVVLATILDRLSESWRPNDSQA